ncbi:MAG: acyl-CoA/acyl-ACP dehydrogenase [Bacteroidales bacterium]|nr:acyl-CoA/acyl-ACP dehydrogenase [Bacteroidales bacterium]
MIDFELSPDQKMLYEWSLRFSQKYLLPVSDSIDFYGELSQETIKQLEITGFFNYFFDDIFFSILTNLLVIENLAFGCAAISSIVSSNYLSKLLYSYAVNKTPSEIPLFEVCNTLLFSRHEEIHNQHKIAHIECVGDRFILKGHASKIIMPREACVISMVTPIIGATNPQSIAYLEIPAAHFGISFENNKTIMGLRGIQILDVNFDNIEINQSDKFLIMDYQKFNYTVVDRIRVAYLLCLASQSIGIGRSAINEIHKFAQQNGLFTSSGSYSHSLLSKLKIQVNALELLLWHYAWSFDKGELLLNDSEVVVKYILCEANQIVYASVELGSGLGRIKDFRVEILQRDIRALISLSNIEVPC